MDHLDVVSALIEAGADINKADKNNDTPLKVAEEEEFTEIVKAIEEARKAKNAMQASGSGPKLKMNWHLLRF